MSSASFSATSFADESTPMPGDFTPGLADRFPDLLPGRAFYLAEVITPAFTPADLIALKELVETDGGTSLKLKRAWVPYNRCSSGVLPLDTFEELKAAGIVQESDNVSPVSLKREALDSVDAVHRDSGFQPKEERMESVSSASSVRPKQKKLEMSSSVSEGQGSTDSSGICFSRL